MNALLWIIFLVQPAVLNVTMTTPDGQHSVVAEDYDSLADCLRAQAVAEKAVKASQYLLVSIECAAVSG